MIKNRHQPGFVLLFAVLLVSVVLAISLVLFNITLRQLVLSTTSRDSQLAYYASYAGLDCALYWEKNYDLLDDPPDQLPENKDTDEQCFGAYRLVGGFFDPDDSSPNDCSITCGVSASLTTTYVDTVSPFSSTLTIDFANGTCAKVEVFKQTPNILNDILDTKIVSRGYNRACNALTSNRTIERANSTTHNDNWN